MTPMINMGNYMVNSSTGHIPASQGQAAPATAFLMSGESLWSFPSMGNSGSVYRGSSSVANYSGLNFMNLPTPMALLPGQQLGGGGGGPGVDGHLGMLAALNAFKYNISGGGGTEAMASGHGGSGDDGED